MKNNASYFFALKVVSKIVGGVAAIVGVWALCCAGTLMLIQSISPQSYKSFLEDFGKL